MQKRRFYPFCVTIFLVVLFTFVSCSKNNITIGIISNFAGQNSQSSKTSLKVLNKLADDYNLTHKKHIKIISIDDSYNREKSINAYKTIIDKSDIIIYSTTSTAFMGSYPLIKKYSNKLHIGMGMTTSAISGLDDNIIRHTLDVEYEQKSIAEFINRQHSKNILIYQDVGQNLGYTKLALKYFRTYYKGDTTISKFSALKIDVDKIRRDFKRGNYKFVYILAGSTSREAGIIIQNIRKLNRRNMIVTTPWVNDLIFLNLIGQHKKNIVIPGQSLISPKYKPFNDFKKIVKLLNIKRYGYLAGLSYDVANILFPAITNSNSLDAKVLKQYIISKEYDGTTGKIKFNRYGDEIGNLNFYRIENGKYILCKDDKNR